MDGSLLVSLRPGSVVRSAGRAWRVTRDLTFDTVLAEDVETGEAARIRVDAIDASASRQGEAGGAVPEPDAVGAIASIPEEAWAVAQGRFRAIEPLLDRRDRRRDEVEAAAKTAEVSPATLYGWIGRFELSGHVSSLLPRPRGRRCGDKQLSAEMEQIVLEFVEKEYLQKQKRTVQDVIDALGRYCETQGLKPPGDRTIHRRIAELDEAYKLRRRGRRDEARRYEPKPGKYPATTYPLEVVQIDHTPADLEVVTDDRLHVLGRPWITLAIDVHTRMVVGYWLGMERPNAHSVGLCICMAIQTKHAVLAALDLPGDWPVWGMPTKIFCDNAGEFDNKTVHRACEEHGIGLEFRPVGKPEYGGHIESLCRTVNRQAHKVPGTTFSNPIDRGRYQSGKEAVLTLDEFERWLVNYIVNTYNAKPHSGIEMAPIAKWKDGILGTPTTRGRGLPGLLPDPERLRVDFLPFKELTIQQYGLQWDGVRYWDPPLNRWIRSKDEGTGRGRRFVVRRDPRRIDQVWFLDPATNTYLPIRYADRSMPAMSAWEHRAAKRTARSLGAARVDQDTVKQGHEINQRIIVEGTAKTRAARRAARRRTDRERAMGQTLADPHNLRSPKPPVNSWPGAADDVDGQDVPMPDEIDIGPYA